MRNGVCHSDPCIRWRFSSDFADVADPEFAFFLAFIFLLAPAGFSKTPAGNAG